MPKNFKDMMFSDNARKKITNGIEKLASVVCHTLGPNGKNVALDKGWGSHAVTSNGNAILKLIDLPDAFENLGAQVCKEIASKLKSKCGDGSTTAVLLLHKIVAEAMKHISSGASPVLLKRGLEKAVVAIIRKLEEVSVPVTSEKDILSLAMVSSHGAFSEEVARIIADTIRRVGKEGVVAVEGGRSVETSVEVVDGMRIDKGYASGYFVTDTENHRVELNHPLILVSDQKINTIQEIIPILQSIAASRQELLLIVDDIAQEPLSTLIINKLHGTLKVAVIKAPGFGDQKKGLLEDIAILTGAKFIAEALSFQIKDTKVEMLGSANNVTITKEHTTIVGGKGNEADLASRAYGLRKSAETSENDYDKQKLLQRAAKLQGGVAIVKVGASSETELEHKKQLFEDSLSSTQSGMQKGVVLGGGMALFYASQDICDQLNLEGDELLGGKLLELASESIVKQLAENCGINGDVVISQIQQSNAKTVGFNTLTRSVEDFQKKQILEPTEVVVEALSHASSAASMIILAEALIVERPSANKEKHSSHAGMPY